MWLFCLLHSYDLWHHAEDCLLQSAATLRLRKQTWFHASVIIDKKNPTIIILFLKRTQREGAAPYLKTKPKKGKDYKSVPATFRLHAQALWLFLFFLFSPPLSFEPQTLFRRVKSSLSSLPWKKSIMQRIQPLSALCQLTPVNTRAHITALTTFNSLSVGLKANHARAPRNTFWHHWIAIEQTQQVSMMGINIMLWWLLLY